MGEETSLKRRLAAILAADIGGYMGKEEAATVHARKGHQAARLEQTRSFLAA